MPEMTEEEAVVETYMKYYGNDFDLEKKGETEGFSQYKTAEEGSELFEEKRNVLHTSRVFSFASLHKIFDCVGKRSAL